MRKNLENVKKIKVYKSYNDNNENENIIEIQITKVNMKIEIV